MALELLSRPDTVVEKPDTVVEKLDAAQTPDLVVRHVTRRFGSSTVLDGVSFSIARSSVVALIGANGAGKSTLLRCCMRLIEPDSGSIEILGSEVTRLGGRRMAGLRAQVGFVFQKHNLSGRLSALSNVIHGVQSRQGGPRTWLQSLASNAVREEAMEMLDAVGLADKAMRRVDRLSGGQSQRVAIARALMQRPRMILADEPAASLDPMAGQEIMELLVGLSKTRQVTVLFTTHNIRHALDYSDRVIGLKAGHITVDAPAGSLDPEALRTFYD